MKFLRKNIAIIIVAILSIWSISGLQIKFNTIIKGVPFMVDYVTLMFPPSVANINKLINPLIETIQIAIISIILSGIIALPLSFFCARNMNKSKHGYLLFRTIINILRTFPPLIYALIFVAMVGLGPLAGILGLVCHDIGSLSKYFSEAIENINQDLILAIKSTGASKIQQIRYAVIPELKPLFIGYLLTYFEFNIRSATILGLVGAGGIGFKLTQAIRLFQHHEVSIILIIIIVTVIVVDILSGIIRNKIINK